MWLRCMVINVQGNNYYMVEGSPLMWLTCMVINVQGNNYYMVEGALTCGSFFLEGGGEQCAYT